MGRHSAAGGADEDDLELAAGGQIAVEASAAQGRHARPDEGADEEPAPIAPATPVALTKPRPLPDADTTQTAPIAPITDTAPIAPVPTTKPDRDEPGLSPTARDLALFREHSDVRNRGIAALLAPFVVYAVVMVVIDRTDDILVWIWIPLIVAGVLVGLILDLGHKRYAANGSADRP